ncbi:YfiR/HmsC family protein [Aestuariibacter salexigens]|uniref:YfiR/HmsC family protein n=1 Tax=Aestuariibacter salexigens TaxID=226010 RepID=UPI000409CB91|nr:YfiR/HmsC family protein [Aestuariibacter salexigens]
MWKITPKTNRYTASKIISVVMSALLIWLAASTTAEAQTATKESLIAAYVYQLSESIQWREVTSQQTLKFNYLGEDTELFSALSLIGSRSIEDLSLVVARSETIQTAVVDANVIIVDENKQEGLEQLFSLIDRRPILVITINAIDSKLTHINLLTSGTRMTFELNRYTLAYNNLPIDIDVLVLGGREVDIAELLKELQREVAVKEQQLADVTAIIDSQQQTIEQQINDIAKAEKSLEAIRQQLMSEGEEVKKLEVQVMSLNDDVRTAKSTLAANNKTIQERELALENQLKQIQRNEGLIAEQQRKIGSQEETIRETSARLSEREIIIAEQTEQIQKSDELISTQNLVIIIIVTLMLLITFVFIAFLRRSKKLRLTHQALLETKDQLVESEKMASLGFLVAGVAHEMNTPLGNIITASSSLEHELNEVSTRLTSQTLSRSMLEKLIENSREAVQLISNNQQRAANLISRFKELSADELAKDSQQVVVRQLLDDAYHFHLNGDDRERLKLDIDCHSDLHIHCNVTALVNVVTQLMCNAALHGDSSSDGKTPLNIACKQQGTNLTMRFQNDGQPLTEDEKRQLFEPFYTTKRHKGLVGLGLHICYNIVHNHLGGHLHLEDDANGVCFTLTLPVSS